MSNFQVSLFSRRLHVASLCASLSSSYYLCTLKPHGIVYNLRAIFQVVRLSWKIRSVAKRLICRYFSVRCVSLSPRLPCVLITETLGLRSAKQRSKIVSAECWQDEGILYEWIVFLPMQRRYNRCIASSTQTVADVHSFNRCTRILNVYAGAPMQIGES